jgi:preprotein translocase subunit YajC
MGNYSTLVMIALMVLAFYLLILRPQKKRQQAIQQTLNSLAPGSRVLLGSGLFGTIVAIGNRQAVLEISPGVELTVLKQAIVRTVTDADEDGVLSDDDDLAEDELSAGDAVDDGPRDQTVLPQDVDHSAGSNHTGSTVVSDGSDRTTPSAGADPKRLS